MFFRPNPNDELIISGVTYRVAEHPSAPGIPHGQEGRAGIVYHLHPTSSGKKAVGENLALKVFKPRFRLPYLVSQAERIATYADLPGLQVCRRTVLSPSRHVELLRQHPDLTYAVLMPWIEGPTWLEVVLEKKPYSREQSLALARALTETLVRMEEQGIAHCDLSGPNVMLPILAGREGLELVDVEGMYAPGLPQPEALSSGSAGYAHKAIKDGVWNPKADRFAGAVLLAEMLGWCDAQVCQSAWSESYFEPGETQQNGKRYQTLLTSLRHHWGDGVAGLFERTWQSDSLSDCPTFGEWLVALPVSSEQRVVSSEQAGSSLPSIEKKASENELSGIQETEDSAPEKVESVREVRAFMQAARRMEERGNLDGAIETYRQAQELAASDPALGSLANEIKLTLRDVEVRRRGMAHETLPQPSPAPTKQTIDSSRLAPEKRVWWPWAIGALIIGFMLYMAFQRDGVYVPVATEAPAIIEEVPVVTEAPAATESPVVAFETITAENADRLQQQIVWGGMGAPYSMDWSQDGRWIAVGTNIGLYLYDASTYRLIWFTQTNSWVRSVVFSPDGAYAAAGVENSVKVWLTSDGSLVHSLEGHTGGMKAVAFSPDGGLIASGSWDQTVRIWNAADGTLRNTLSDEEGSIRAVAFSPGGDTLASSSGANIKLWNLADGSIMQTLTGHEELVSSLSFSSDGTFLTSGSFDQTIKVWNVSSDELIQTLSGHSDAVMDVHFLPDNNQIISSSWDRSFKIWDIDTGQEALTIDGHWNGIRSVRYSDNRNQIATASWDGTVKIWSSQDGSLLHTIQFTPITDIVKVTSDNSYIAALSGYNDSVHFFDVQGNEVGVFVGDEIWSMDLSPNDLLAVTDKDGKISLVDMPSGNLVGELQGPTEGANSVAFSQDGARLVAGYYNNTAIVWDVPNREQILTLQNDTSVESVAFSPTGNMVATGSYDETAQVYLVKVWNIPDGNIVQVFERYTGTGIGTNFIFSPDGTMIAFPTEEINNDVATRKIELRSTQNGDLIRSFDVNAEEWINAIIFSNDGTMLAAGSSGNSIRLWRVSDGQILISLDASIQGVNGIAFAPDMSFLVSVGQDSTIRIWQVLFK